MSRKLLVMFMAAMLAVMALAAGCGNDKAASTEKVLKVGTNADFAPFEFQGGWQGVPGL